MNFICEKMINLCKYTFGRSLTLKGEPTSYTYDESYFFHNSLYDKNQNLIQVSSYVTGETLGGIFNSHIYAPEYLNSVEFSSIKIENSFWLGYFHTHYGHFLLSTLQRLWKIDHKKDFIIAPNFNKSTFNQLDYIKIIFDALEIDEDKLISPQSGSELNKVTINQPIFIENYYCYSEWSNFMKNISKKIIHNYCKNPNKIPVYISRSQIEDGTRFFNGEEYLSEILRKFGIETFYPEKMSFIEQLSFWNKNEIFIGFSGSSFITSAFFGEKKLVILNHDDYIFGSQLMVDTASRNKSIYLNIEKYISKNQDKGFSIIDYNSIVNQIFNSIRIIK